MATPPTPTDPPAPTEAPAPAEPPRTGAAPRTGEAGEAGDDRGRRWGAGLVLLGLGGAGLVVGALWQVAQRPEPGLQVVEVGVGEATFTGVQAPGTGLSWAAVVANAGSQTAVEPLFDLEVLDDDGDVLDTYILSVDHLAPGATTALAGTVDEARATDVRLVPRCAGDWQDADEAPGAVAVDDVEVGTDAENAPVVRYTATSSYEEPLDELRTVLVFRNADGRIVGGASSLVMEHLLAPGEPVTDHVTGPARLAGVATVDVYTRPESSPDVLC